MPPPAPRARALLVASSARNDAIAAALVAAPGELGPLRAITCASGKVPFDLFLARRDGDSASLSVLVVDGAADMASEQAAQAAFARAAELAASAGHAAVLALLPIASTERFLAFQMRLLEVADAAGGSRAEGSRGAPPVVLVAAPLAEGCADAIRRLALTHSLDRQARVAAAFAHLRESKSGPGAAADTLREALGGSAGGAAAGADGPSSRERALADLRVTAFYLLDAFGSIAAVAEASARPDVVLGTTPASSEQARVLQAFFSGS
jgi:hypothetical protein